MIYRNLFVPTKPLPIVEFISLMALMTSFVALSIDAMLPALAIISDDLGASHENDRQLVIGVLFFGKRQISTAQQSVG